MQNFPIQEIVNEVAQGVKENPIILVHAPPGAGKSTILPLHLLQENVTDKKIIMLEPRRLAARSVAERMASLLNEPCGQRVGYRVRFENKVSTNTRLEVVTEGILTRMLQKDNALEEAGVLIFDEFHERSLQADLALALALQCQQILRPDLRIIIMSATLDIEELNQQLNRPPLYSSEGRTFPVTTRYLNLEHKEFSVSDVVNAIRLAEKEEVGDILVFMPGAGEINRVKEELESKGTSLSVHSLYGDLPFKEQQEALLPIAGKRKVVLSTAIAETSLTIEGIKTVIDSGWMRVQRFDPRSGLSRLVTLRITRDAAEQRRGRAGRLSEGVCYRLWSEGMHHNLQPKRAPEILEAELSALMLELAAWGVSNPSELTFITPPPIAAIQQATELLENLGAIKDGKITEEGKLMASYPTHPRMAHLLWKAQQLNKEELKGLACDLVALLEERDPLAKERGVDLWLRVKELISLRNKERVQAERSVLNRIDKLSNIWTRFLKTTALTKLPQEEEIGLLLASAYPERIAKVQDKQKAIYKMANGRMVSLNNQDELSQSDYLVIANSDSGQTIGKIHLAAVADEKDLENNYCRTTTEITWNENLQRAEAVEKKSIGAIVFATKANQQADLKLLNQRLIAEIKSRGLRWLGADENFTNTLNRINCFRKWNNAEELPELNEGYLLQNLEEWLGPFLTNSFRLSDVEKIDLKQALLSSLPYTLQTEIETHTPENIEVPSGSSIKINYQADASDPVLEVRLQEVFGWMKTPTINRNRITLTLHLLSPAFRPVQVTKDLESFWRNTYAEVRKELRIKYKKHSWPEDPFNATAVAGPVKRKQNP